MTGPARFEVHPEAADLVEVTRHMAMAQGKSPAQIIAWLLEAYSEEPPPDDLAQEGAAVPEGTPDAARAGHTKGRPAVHDSVNHPSHYTAHPSGVECIEITEAFGFNVGNAIKYLWRADEKGMAIEDLSKAGWYVQREIRRREAAVQRACPVLGTVPAS